MEYPLIISMSISLAVPVLVGYFVSRFVLCRLAEATGKHRGWDPKSTVYNAVRLPVMLLAWIIGVSLASMFLRRSDLPLVERFEWPLFDLWLKAVATLAVFFVAYRFVTYGVRIAAGSADASASILLRKLLAMVFVVIAAITVLNQFGIQVGPLLASLGVAGLAAALALQDTLSNYFAGILIAIDKPIRPGDFVKLEGQEGFVESIGWRTTRIRPYAETIVVVPNSKVANSILTNLAYPTTESKVYVPVIVEFDSNLILVEETALEVARAVQANTEGADPDYTPVIVWDRIGDAGVEFRAILRADHFDNVGAVRGAFIKSLIAAFNQKGIHVARRITAEPIPAAR